MEGWDWGAGFTIGRVELPISSSLKVFVDFSAGPVLASYLSLLPSAMISCSGDLDWKMHSAISRALCSVCLWYLEHSGWSPTCCDLHTGEVDPVGLGITLDGGLR